MVHRNDTIARPNSLYDIDFDGRVTAPIYDYKHARVTYGIIAVGLYDNQLQDYSFDATAGDGSHLADDRPAILFHSTRDAYVAASCGDGLKSSGRSHEVVGLWTRGDENPSAAFDWGCTPLDETQWCYFHLQADRSKVIKRKRLGADRSRAVIATSLAQGSFMKISICAYDTWLSTYLSTR